MAFYTRRVGSSEGAFPGGRYTRFLVLSATGFFLGGLALLGLGALVFQPHHGATESGNVEALVSFVSGALSLALAVLFALMLIIHHGKLQRSSNLTKSLLLDGQENTLYQVLHAPRKPTVLGPIPDDPTDHARM